MHHGAFQRDECFRERSGRCADCRKAYDRSRDTLPQRVEKRRESNAKHQKKYAAAKRAKLARDPALAHAERARRKEYARAWLAAHPEVRARYAAVQKAYSVEKRKDPEFRRSQFAKHLERTFGLTLEQWSEMLIAQGGRCPVCQDPLDPRGQRTHTDHCHRTGRVRGILCYFCNHLVGVFEKRPNTVIGVLKFLGEAPP